MEEQRRMKKFLRRVNGREKEKRWKRRQAWRRWGGPQDNADDEDESEDSEEEEYNNWVKKRFFNKGEDHESDNESKGKIEEEDSS